MNELFRFPNYLEKYNKKDASSSEETSFSIVHNLYCLVAYIWQGSEWTFILGCVFEQKLEFPVYDCFRNGVLTPACFIVIYPL